MPQCRVTIYYTTPTHHCLCFKSRVPTQECVPGDSPSCSLSVTTLSQQSTHYFPPLNTWESLISHIFCQNIISNLNIHFLPFNAWEFWCHTHFLFDDIFIIYPLKFQYIGRQVFIQYIVFFLCMARHTTPCCGIQSHTILSLMKSISIGLKTITCRSTQG